MRGVKLTTAVGDTFNRWTIVGEADSYRNQRCVMARCECGTERVVRLSGLTTGSTKSCGCLTAEVASKLRKATATHGRSGVGDPTYTTWKAMFGRTTRESSPDYCRYGGRGIAVDPRWNLFQNFVADMGDRPSDQHSIERLNNDKSYCKENCVWATRSEQADNRRSSVRFEYNGELLSINELVKLCTIGLSYDTIYQRLTYRGYSVVDALTVPLYANPSDSMSATKHQLYPKELA